MHAPKVHGHARQGVALDALDVVNHLERSVVVPDPLARVSPDLLLDLAPGRRLVVGREDARVRVRSRDRVAQVRVRVDLFEVPVDIAHTLRDEPA